MTKDDKGLRATRVDDDRADDADDDQVEQDQVDQERVDGADDDQVFEHVSDKGGAPDDQIELAVSSTTPTSVDQYNRCLFEFARWLRSLPGVDKASHVSLRGYARRWHNRTSDVTGAQDFDTTWSDFLNAWSAVRFARGAKPMKAALELACNDPLPAILENYDSIQTKKLIMICRALQRVSGDAPFFLSVRYAGWLIDLDHVATWRRLKALVVDGVLEQVERGTSGKHGQAARFRYVGGD